jgi:aerobic carbon-monoxide dehydrogenase medium subunit
MIPYAFRYRRVKSVAEAQSLFYGCEDPEYLAGGQTLIPAMKQRLANPSDLIDLSALSELKFVELRGSAVVIGAAVCHRDVADSQEIGHHIPALAFLAGSIGDPAVRHMGTLGGSLANSDPAADYPAAVLGLGATIRTTRKTIDADAYFLGMFQTALGDGEIIMDVSFPLPERAGYAKFPNPASRYAMAGVFVSQREGEVRVAVTGAGPCVFRMREMEEALTRHFAPEAIAGISVPGDGMNSDIHASAEYRAHLVTVMARRAIEQALEHAKVRTAS